MNTSARVLLVTLASVGSATAQLPIGEPFAVHEFDAGRQDDPRIAAQPERSFVVVWESEGVDGDGCGVRIRRFSPNGVPLTPELPVNETTTGHQLDGDLAVDGAGNVVVVWSGPGLESTDIFVRHLAADLTPLSSELIVNAETAGPQSAPRVDCRDDGRFAVTWRSGESLEEVVTAVLEPPLVPVVPELVVNTTPGRPNITRLQAPGLRSDGGFVVVWEGVGTGQPSTQEIYHRRYSAAGAPLTGELQVSDPGPYGLPNFAPQVTVEADDSYRILWRHNANLVFDRFETRKVTAEGDVGPIEPLVHTDSAGAASGSDGGEFVVVTLDYTGSHGFRYDAEGRPIVQFAISALDYPAAVAPVGASTEDLVVVAGVWNGHLDLVAQRFGRTLFADGFESGDTSEWTQTVP